MQRKILAKRCCTTNSAHDFHCINNIINGRCRYSVCVAVCCAFAIRIQLNLKIEGCENRKVCGRHHRSSLVARRPSPALLFSNQIWCITIQSIIFFCMQFLPISMPKRLSRERRLWSTRGWNYRYSRSPFFLTRSRVTSLSLVHQCTHWRGVSHPTNL